MVMRTKSVLSACATSIALLFFSCGGEKKVKQAQENIVIFHTIGDPDGLHPSTDNSGPRTELNNYTQVFMMATDIKNNQLKIGRAHV